MPVRADYPAGMPCWIDCITCDPDATRGFYRELFGWTFVDEGGGYQLMRHRGEIVGGLGVAPPGRQHESFWTTYLASKDLDVTLASVHESGGSVVMPPMDAGGAGRLFLAVDPGGAAVGFWQGARPEGVVLADEPGAMVWHEMRTPTAAVLGFYRRLFPLETTADADDDITVTLAGRPGFSVHESTEAPRWIPHLGVASVASSRDHAVSLGATVLPGADAATAYVRDPAGAVFALRETTTVVSSVPIARM